MGMLLGSFGGKREPRMPPEGSAVAVIACAAVILLTLIAVSVRLAIRRGRAPVSVSGAVFVLIVSVLSMTIVLARNGGTVSPTIIVMLATNAVCLLAGCVAIIMAVRRRPVDTGHA